MLPLSSVFASTNQNEKKHSLTILDRAKQILKNSRAKLRSVIADSQYSDNKIRIVADKTVIPYPANQRRGVEDVLRVDKKFRTYGSEDQKIEYHKRPSIEAVNSFLKTQYRMATNKVRGLKASSLSRTVQHTVPSFKQRSSSNLGRPDKAVSPTYFNT